MRLLSVLTLVDVTISSFLVSSSPLSEMCPPFSPSFFPSVHHLVISSKRHLFLLALPFAVLHTRFLCRSRLGLLHARFCTPQTFVQPLCHPCPSLFFSTCSPFSLSRPLVQRFPVPLTVFECLPYFFFLQVVVPAHLHLPLVTRLINFCYLVSSNYCRRFLTIVFLLFSPSFMAFSLSLLSLYSIFACLPFFLALHILLPVYPTLRPSFHRFGFSFYCDHYAKHLAFLL